MLVAGLKKSANTASTIRRSIDTRYDIDQVKRACLMLNTADYCQTVSAEVWMKTFLLSSQLTHGLSAPQLEEKLKERLQTGFKEKLSFQDEHDLFVKYLFAFALPFGYLISFTVALFQLRLTRSFTNLNSPAIQPSQ